MSDTKFEHYIGGGTWNDITGDEYPLTNGRDIVRMNFTDEETSDVKCLSVRVQAGEVQVTAFDGDHETDMWYSPDQVRWIIGALTAAVDYSEKETA